MPIPVQNIYYLLSYAWTLGDAGEESRVTAAPGDKVLNLLATLLCRNTLRLLRQGLIKGYIKRTGTLATIKGKIAVTATLKNDLFREGKAICAYETLNHDILPNQLIKATLIRLLNTTDLAPELQRSLRMVSRSFEPVSAIELNDFRFTQLPVNSGNNKYYERVLPLCRFIQQNLLPEAGGSNFF